MIELPLVFLGGLLGSAHCVGMCGGFAVLIGLPARRWWGNLSRQLVYSSGRIFTYAAIGGGVGYGGLRLSQEMGALVNAQAIVALSAGALLVVQGLLSAGVLDRVARSVGFAYAPTSSGALLLSGSSTAGMGCLMTGFVGAFLRDRRLSHAFLAGVFTGLLPCGLVYAYLALAASTSDLFGGMATMAAFGLGTTPLMVVAGSGISLLTPAGRRRLLLIASWCVVLTGLISIARGVGFLQFPHAQLATGCPLCDPPVGQPLGP